MGEDNNLYNLFSSARVRRLQIWSAASAGTAVTNTCKWNPVDIGVQDAVCVKTVSDTSISPTEPAYVDTSPPPLTHASYWHTADNSGYIMSLTVPSGAILDVTVEFTVAYGYTNTPVAVTNSSNGKKYWQPLDGSGDILLPVDASYAT